jgi:hypothetical protein
MCVSGPAYRRRRARARPRPRGSGENGTAAIIWSGRFRPALRIAVVVRGPTNATHRYAVSTARIRPACSTAPSLAAFTLKVNRASCPTHDVRLE